MNSQTITIPNFSMYTLSVHRNQLILTPKPSIQNIIYLNDKDFLDLNFAGAKLIFCTILTEEGLVISSHRKHFMTVLLDVWKSMGTEQVMKYGGLGVERSFQKQRFARWVPELDISYHHRSIRTVIHELVKMTRLNNYSMEIQVQLKNKMVIHYNHNIIDDYYSVNRAQFTNFETPVETTQETEIQTYIPESENFVSVIQDGPPTKKIKEEKN